MHMEVNVELVQKNSIYEQFGRLLVKQNMILDLKCKIISFAKKKKLNVLSVFNFSLFSKA